MTPKKLFGLWLIMVALVVIANAAILAGSVWLVVKVLQWMKVL